MESASFSSPPAAPSPSSTTNVNTKIHNDLQIVMDKMNGCETLLKNSSTPTQELLAVVGFLEACQPRMIELVEAAAQGALSEQVLMECLQVNDRLTKILGDVDRQVDFGNDGTVDANGPPQFVIQDEETEDDLLLMDDFGDGQKQKEAPAPAPAATAPTTTEDEPLPAATAGPKTTGEDLDDLLDLNNEAMEELGLGAEEGDISNTKSEDEFDDFFSSRQMT